MLKKFLIIWTVLLGFLPEIVAQETPMFSQYMMNGFLYNPAIAGSDGYTSFNLTSRLQWAGIKDAPRTNSISFQTRLLRRNYMIRRNSVKQKNKVTATRSGRVGIGGAILTDRTGAFNRTGVQFTYGYHIFLNNSQLSFGLTGNIYQFKYDFTRDQFADPDLVAGLVTQLNKSFYVPDANFGVFYLRSRTYAGISVENMLQSSIRVGNTILKETRLLRTYYLTGAYHIKINYDFDLEPSLIARINEKIAFQADATCKVFYKENYWLGLSLRTNKEIISFLGVHYDRFYFGYAFDYGLNMLTSYTYGSHEVMLALKFGDNARRYRWLIRY
jgi:type IX secretion system PorP/SprF family membrane protein